MKRAHKKNRFYEILVRPFLGVFVFFLFSFICYNQCIKNSEKEIFEHKNKLGLLEKKRAVLKKENEDLNLMVNSLSDPAWIELILMRDLGVVPEGKLKIHFVK